jgi:biotin carboxyl carrier protein
LTRSQDSGPVKAPTIITRIAPEIYRVEIQGHAHIVHVAGAPGDRWLHWNGQVFHRPFEERESPRSRRGGGVEAHQSLSAPMPATVRTVVATPGMAVKRGDVLLVLEAMKMELPIAAMSDGVVRSVGCTEGELVQPGTVLVELE